LPAFFSLVLDCEYVFWLFFEGLVFDPISGALLVVAFIGDIVIVDGQFGRIGGLPVVGLPV
jgi:hypothetical protein